MCYMHVTRVKGGNSVPLIVSYNINYFTLISFRVDLISKTRALKFFTRHTFHKRSALQFLSGFKL